MATKWTVAFVPAAEHMVSVFIFSSFFFSFSFFGGGGGAGGGGTEGRESVRLLHEYDL